MKPLDWIIVVVVGLVIAVSVIGGHDQPVKYERYDVPTGEFRSGW